ncbi:MAG: methyltransferase domain-containing protein [Pseudomonadota bacterium]
MTEGTVPKGLWAPRSVEETLDLYADWAGGYDADMVTFGYVTPARLAQALSAHLPDKDTPILDFGCGTGVSGAALAQAGFLAVDGTDISPEMLAEAEKKGVYRSLFPGTVGDVPDLKGYGAVTATGVVSLGAAPASLLAPLVTGLERGALLAFSYNEATLRDMSYHEALADLQVGGHAVVLASQHGPHLPKKEGAQTSTVYVVRRL